MNTSLQSIDPDEVFCLCQDIYKDYNINLKYPKARDIKKTYQYRYLSAICSKFLTWGLDRPEIKRFLEIAIGNSFRQKTIKKGLSALHQKNLLEISYEQLINTNGEQRQIDLTFNGIIQFLNRYCVGVDPALALRKRDNSKSNMVLTNLFQAGKINVEFISVNDLCREIAMEAISKESQDMPFLPSLGKIYKVNRDISSNREKFTNYLTVKKWGRS